MRAELPQSGLPSEPDPSSTEGDLFASLVGSSPNRPRRGVGWWASTVGHTVGIAALLLVPILWPETPPETVDYIKLLIYDPPPPPPPPPPKGSEMADQAKPSQPSQPEVRPDPTPEPKLVAEIPVESPDQIQPDRAAAEQDQYGTPTGHELGVAEGIEGGDPLWGQVGGVLGGQPGGVVGGTGTTPVFDFDRGPTPIRMTRPQYPHDAFVKKVEGTVLVEILIDERGRVVRARILDSIPLLDQAAIRTVKEWLFTPAIKNGRPVATVANAPVRFRIF